MPIYEFICRSCGEEKEYILEVSEQPPQSCAACGGMLVKKISAPAIQFKGDGWYVTDYGGKKPGSSTLSEPSESAEKDGSKTPDSESNTPNS